MTNEAEVTPEITGDLIAALPNRDALIVADSTDESALWMLCNLVEDISSKPRQLTTTLFRRLAEDAWAPWIPEPGTRNYQRIRTLHMRELAACYAEQKRLLQDMEPSEEDPPFIASLMAVQRAGSRVPITYCVWGEGVDALLPWAEYVTFARQGDEQPPQLVGGAWERVCAIVGGRIEPQQLYRPRERVRQFPSEAQLAEIGPLEI